MPRRVALMQWGGVALIPVGLYWVLLGIPVDLGSPTSITLWLVTVPYEVVGLVVLGSGLGCLLRRTASCVVGATTGLASAAWCLTRMILTTERERSALAARFADVGATGWLIAVVVCGALAGAALLAAPELRDDSVPTGGPTARDSWQWAALAVSCIQLVYLVALFGLASTLDSDLALPPTPESATMAVLWLGCGVVAAMTRGLWPVICAAGLALAAAVVQVIFDARTATLGPPGITDLRVWLAVVLVVTALVCLWALPMLRGWTPATRRQLEARPKGILD